MHRDFAHRQHGVEPLANADVMCWQDIRRVCEKVKHQLIRVAPQFRQLIAQTPLHCQQQFNAARTGTHHGNCGFTGVRFHSLKQRQPAVVKKLNRLDGNCMLCSPSDLMQLRCGADVDGELVVRHGRTIAAQHFLINPVQADDFITVQARTGEHRQPREVDMHFVIVVMPCDVAWKHAGVGRVHVGADQREANTGNRFHAKFFKHNHMAVPAAHQHDVSEDRLISCLH